MRIESGFRPYSSISQCFPTFFGNGISVIVTGEPNVGRLVLFGFVLFWVFGVLGDYMPRRGFVLVG